MKKLFRDAWRAVTGLKSGDSPRNYKLTEDSSGVDLMEADALFESALVIHQAGRLLEAQESYHRILKLVPDHASALHFLGVSHGQSGNFGQAEELIRQSIRLRPIPEYFSNLAMVLDGQGRSDEAIAARGRAAELAPEDAATCVALGDALAKAGRVHEAEQTFRTALGLKPDDADLYFKWAEVLVALKRTADAVEAYRSALSRRPSFPDACNNLGNLLAELDRDAEAESIYRQGLKLQPDAPAIHCNLGQLLQKTGRFDEAEAAYRQAMVLQPDLAAAHNGFGNLCVITGRGAEGEHAYRRAIELQPDFFDAHNNLGNLLRGTGRRDEAEAAYRRSLALKPDFAKAWSNLGMLLEESGRTDEAKTAHERALSFAADDAATHFNAANFYCRINRKTEAENAYRRALDLRPGYSEACGNLGSLLQADGRLTEAEVFLRQALALNPDSAGACYNLAGLLLETRQFVEAEAMLIRALDLQPELTDACNRLGTLYKETGRVIEAESAYRRALVLQPDSSGNLSNLGLLLHEVERFAEAEDCYRAALKIDPGNDFAQYNFGLYCLSLGRFGEGWEGYERRWQMKGFNALRHQSPQLSWQGGPLDGQSMVVWQEQGVGDVILYAGLIPDLLARGPRLILECEARLVPLLARSFPQARVVMRSDIVHPATLEAYWQSPLGSLCRWLRASHQDFKWHGAYLKPDEKRVSAFRERYRRLGGGPVIGISWRSSNYKVGTRKSLSLSELTPMLKLPGAVFVNLQYGDCKDEIEDLEKDTGVKLYTDDQVNPLKDLDAFAAQVAAMDLVISTSNSTVHFAGAMAVPVWTLLPRGDALLWYWFREVDSSPWYPSMRLFRQDSPGDWSGPVSRIQELLPAFIAAHQQGDIRGS
jgi:tetratricopeptide (TPR) repeat protein